MQAAETDTALRFCEKEPVVFRHIVHELAPPCPEWDEAMQRWDFVEGRGAVLKETADPIDPSQKMRCFTDSTESVHLLACLRGNSLRVEGQVKDYSEFADWCPEIAPTNLETSDTSIRECLNQALGPREWRQGGGQYTATRETFRPRERTEVRRLGPEDHPMWQRFVTKYASDPFVGARGGSQAAARDFEFMCLGLPIDYYFTCEGDEITGVLTVNPFTEAVDEISTVFVPPESRRMGLATSLLSTATQSILSKGKQPAYSAAGSPQERPDLFHMLTAIGYYLVSVPWETP